MREPWMRLDEEEWLAFMPFHPGNLDWDITYETLREQMDHLTSYVSTFPPSRPPDARTAAPEGGVVDRGQEPVRRPVGPGEAA